VEQLTTLDAGFLEAEDSDRHVSLAIGGLAVVDGPAPDYDVLVATLGERVPSIPRFTQVLHTHLFDLSAPEWVDDARFDVAHHVHRRALPQPGDDAALFRLVAEIMERRLDRDRPLWECWIIEGLAEGRWAMLTKLHHCIADGISATHVLTGLCDGTDAATFADRIRGAKESKPQAIGPSGLGLNPLNWIGGMWRLSTAVTSAAVRATMGAVEIAAAVVTPADSSLTGPVSSLRRYSAARVSLVDVATVCQKFDVTINDVALAAITDSFRAFLDTPRRTAPPEFTPHPGAGVGAICRRFRQARQSRIGDAAVPPHRVGGSSGTAASGPQPIGKNQVQRATTSRKCVLFGSQLHPVCDDGLGRFGS